MIRLMSGNSRILLTVDERGAWSELYYPHPGLHQQLQNVRVGLFDVEDEKFEWLDSPSPGTRDASPIQASDAARTHLLRMGLNVTLDDAVHPNLDLVIRRITLENPSQSPRRMRVFHYQSLNIGGSLYQGTAYWDDERRTVTHYRGDTYFQFLGRPDFDAFSCGEHTLKGLRGSFVDAEDGALQGNRISHGAADSVVQWNVDVPAGQSRTVHMMLTIGGSRRQIHDAFTPLVARDPALYLTEAVGYNSHWASRGRTQQARSLGGRIPFVYERSLFVMRDCQAATGAIIASPDCRTLNLGGDTYNYNWWRDGAYIAMAMSDVGLHQQAQRFLRFAAQCQEPDGSFLHRHLPDGALGSTWHPPPFLQADQTASVLDAAWTDYSVSGDLDALLASWPLIRNGADWLMGFVGDDGLPKPSFDLWEERKSVNTYTVAAIVSGLRSAARAGKALAKRHDFWNEAAERMHARAVDLLWDPTRQAFLKSLHPRDATIDASLLLALRVGLVAPEDARFAKTVRTVEETLMCAAKGGIARYEGDQYYGAQNPWIICTLWLADCHLRLGDVARAHRLVSWCADQASPTGLLPEQVDARTGEATSVTPLVWSHSTFVELTHRLARATAAAGVPAASVPSPRAF